MGIIALTAGGNSKEMFLTPVLHATPEKTVSATKLLANIKARRQLDLSQSSEKLNKVSVKPGSFVRSLTGVRSKDTGVVLSPGETECKLIWRSDDRQETVNYDDLTLLVEKSQKSSPT